MSPKNIDEAVEAITNRFNSFVQNASIKGLSEEQQDQIFAYLDKIDALDRVLSINDHDAIEKAQTEQDQLLIEVKALYKKFLKENKGNDLATRKMP